MNKKIGFMILSLIVLAGLFTGMASATVLGYSSFGFVDLRLGSEQVIQGVVDFSEPFLQVLLGGQNYTGTLLFERFIIFVLLLSIVYLSLSKTPFFKGNKAVIWVVTIAVPLLAIRFMDFDWLNSVILQYTILGVVLTSILPFIIYFLFLHGFDQPTIRKVGWILFLVVYYGLWSTTGNATYGQYYLLTMLLSLLLLIFDGTIHRYFLIQKIKESDSTGIWDQINKLEEMKSRYYGPYSTVPEDQRKTQVDKIQRQIDELRKHLT